MKWPDEFGLAVWLPTLELLFDGSALTIPRSHDRDDVSRALRCLPGVPTLLCTGRMHAYRLESRIPCQLASSLGHLHHMFCLLFCCPEWYLICCRSSFSQPCMTETAGRVTPLHMLVE